MTDLALTSVHSRRTTPASTRLWEEQTIPSGQRFKRRPLFTNAASSGPPHDTIIPIDETPGVSLHPLTGYSFQLSAEVNAVVAGSQTQNVAIGHLSQGAGSGGCALFVYQTLAGEAVASTSTPLQMLSSPMDALVAELEELRGLPEGWDGEGAAAPISEAIDDAMSFVRSVRDRARRLAPTPDVDGSVLLEIDDGGSGSFRFRGDGTIIHAIRGVAPGIVRFDGRTVPQEISEALEAAL